LNRKGREERKGTPVHAEEIGALVIDSAMKVHSALGPGLLESAYRACLAHELEMRGLDVSQEKPLPIRYEGAEISVGYRIDLLLNQRWDQTRCQWTMKYSFASLASFAVQDWVAIDNTLPNL